VVGGFTVVFISVNNEKVQYYIDKKEIEKKENDEIDRIRTSDIAATEKQQLINARRGKVTFVKI
jgi:hypothetical protein